MTTPYVAGISWPGPRDRAPRLGSVTGQSAAPERATRAREARATIGIGSWIGTTWAGTAARPFQSNGAKNSGAQPHLRPGTSGVEMEVSSEDLTEGGECEPFPPQTWTVNHDIRPWGLSRKAMGGRRCR